MRRVLILSAAVLAGASGAAWADCSNTQVSPNVLVGNRIVVAAGANSTNEYHGPGNSLTECAQGLTSTIDPTHVVGTWNIDLDGVGLISYDYGPGNHKFTYTVHDNGNGTYSFCNLVGGALAATGTLVGGSCP